MKMISYLKHSGVLLLGCLFLSMLKPGLVYGSGWLHTDGNLIKDADGNPVMLRGVHMYVCLQNEQAKFTRAAAMGANVVRLALWKNAIEGKPTGPCVSADGLGEIDKAVQYAKNAGLKVILDEHIWSLNIENAPLEFFTDSTLQESWLNMWRTLINRYKNDPTVIGVDLMNEPWAISGQVPAVHKPLWEGIVRNAVTQLHPLNPNLIIFISGWGIQTQPMWSDIAFLQQPNIVLSDHIYGQRTFQFLSDRYTAFINADIPVYLGEIGFTPSDQSFMVNQLNNFDSLGLHYTLFVYGVSSWNLPWDIVDSSYNLTTIGMVYRDHLKSLIDSSPMPTPLPGNISFSCGWENTILGSGCWLGKQITADDRFTRVINPVRKGTYAARVEVRPGDNPINSSGERSEVVIMQDRNGNQINENELSGTQFYTISVFLPPDWVPPFPDTHGLIWGLFFQLHGPDVLGKSPAFGFEARDRFSLDMCAGDIARTGNIYDSYEFSDGSLNPGHWTDFVIKIKYAKDATGSVDIWRRNEGITDFTNVLSLKNVPTLQYSSNVNSGTVGSHYWKTGYYRNATTLTNVLYLDSITRGTGFNEVIAEAFPVSVPTPAVSPTSNQADINKDGIIDASDLKLILLNWLGMGSCSNFSCDLNSDSKINAFDAVVVIGNWGR